MSYNQHNILYDGHFISIWHNRYNRDISKQIIKHICVQNGWPNLVKQAMTMHKMLPKGSTDTLTAHLLNMCSEDGQII